MTIKKFLPIGLLTAGLLALAAGPASAATPVQTLNGTVGPGYTISITMAGKKVTSLKAGTYKLVVNDKSNMHDFVIEGPGIDGDNSVTTVPFVGTKSETVVLKKGTYAYYCEPHHTSMKGSIKVS